MNYHHPIIRFARSAGRKIGLVKLLKKVLKQGEVYEDAFSTGLKAAIKPGDVVYDIGANVGYYTSQFVDWVGNSGTVVAFEPLPAACKKLEERLAGEGAVNQNLVVCQIALADREGEAFFEGEADGQGVVTTAHLSDRVTDTDKKLQVQVMTADGAQATKNLPFPTLTKIDVEGYEEDVLQGGTKVFSGPQSKHIFIEIHFERIDERGKGEAPARIVRLLKSWGYKVRWLDASHLHAFRERVDAKATKHK